MSHRIHIKSHEQHLAAIRILDRVKGTWIGLGTSADPVIVVNDQQFDAMVEAGVVAPNGKEVKAHGAKAASKKSKS